MDIILAELMKMFPVLNTALAAGIMVFSRLIGFMRLAPIFNRKEIPGMIKLAFALILTIILMMTVKTGPIPSGTSLILGLILNIAGGMKITDPACDLSVVAAILSSNFDMEIPEKSAFAAEVGLSGEIRPVSQIERRIAEAAKLGFEKIYISSFCSVASAAEKEIEVVKLSNIREIAKELFAKGK